MPGIVIRNDCNNNNLAILGWEKCIRKETMTILLKEWIDINLSSAYGCKLLCVQIEQWDFHTLHRNRNILSTMCNQIFDMLMQVHFATTQNT